MTLRADGLVCVFRRAVDGDCRHWPGRARRVMAGHLELWKLSGFADDAQLLVSELMSNAVCHGRGDVTFRLTCHSDEIRLDVTTGAARPGMRPCPSGPENLAAPGDDEENGRGLHLVHALADRWGISEDGTHAWCCLTTVEDSDPEHEVEATAGCTP